MAQAYPTFRRRRRPPSLYTRPSPLRQFLSRTQATIQESWGYLQLPLTVLAVAHLVLVALFPGGRNALFDWGPNAATEYLTLFRVGDAMGYYTTTGRDGFLIYKVFTQDGTVASGAFPDAAVSPRLRYDRWAMAGDAATGPYPWLHALVTRYVVDRLPKPPVRVELYAAHWKWDRNSLSFPWPGPHLSTDLSVTLLGTYNGFTRAWKPAEPKTGKGGNVK